MRILRVLLLFLVLLGLMFFGLGEGNITIEESDQSISEVPKMESNLASKEVEPLIKNDLIAFIDTSTDKIIQQLGEPKRKDITPYGYTWWIYEKNDTYMQVGVEDHTVQTIYATGDQLNSSPFQIGASYEDIKEQFPFEEKVTYQNGIFFYSFILDEEDITVHPLIKLSEDLFVQCYFDSISETLSSIRVIKGDILLKQRFYEIEYRGNLPEAPTLTDEEWKKVERGMEQQIFDLTNLFRKQFDVPPLKLDKEISEVAYQHSKDMYEQQYFSHQSLDGKGLKERIEAKSVHYLSAGENIAAQHLDAPAAMVGWINSEGHRETLLNEQYSHLGVGVHRLYYTQNFLLKP